MKYTFTLIVMVLICNLLSGQSQPDYLNRSLPPDQRVSDLVKRMSLHEKILQMQHLHDVTSTENFRGNSYGCIVNSEIDANTASARYAVMQQYLKDSTRWGIPAFTCTEALHGAYQAGCTIYPQALAQGSTFNPELVKRMAEQIADELKAMNIRQVLSPDLDLARELRWGRVEETYGEDPFLNGTIGVAYVKTMQSNGIICTPKHFIAHGSPLAGINLAPVAGGERELRSMYMYPFEKVIRETNPLSIMNCYSSYDGEPIAGSHYFLTELLRNELGFKGYVYSDWGSVAMLNYFHKTAGNNTEAAAMAVMAGIDLEAAGSCYLDLEKLVQENMLDEKYIDQAVERILYVKFASGLFDKPLTADADPKQVIRSPGHIALAREIADESIILLKNNNHLLPLSLKKYQTIALIGPNAAQFQPGDYTWTRQDKFGVTLLEGLQTAVGNKVKITYAEGCNNWSLDTSGFQQAIETAQKSDVIIAAVGLGSGTFTDNAGVTCGEGFDLSQVELPGMQEKLLKELQKLGKPLIVVLISGKPAAIPWVKENADAILVQWYGGEQQGNALTDVLLGKVNPSGKLNVSFPQSTGHLPCYYNYLSGDKGFYHQPGSPDKPGRDYVLSSTDPLWSFGYGLSYTSFTYHDAVINKTELTSSDTVQVTVTIKNNGSVAGKEVVQIYVRDLVSSVVTPVRQLKAFRKETIEPGNTKNVTLTFLVNDLYLYNQNMKRIVEPGEFELQIGAASDDIKIIRKIRVK
jgi:beta-glucosidase